MSGTVEIKRTAMVYNVNYLCPVCRLVMWMDTDSGSMWCLGDDAIGQPECPQVGFKFQIPTVELTLKEYGNPQVTAP